MAIGLHYVFDLYGCRKEPLETVGNIQLLLQEVVHVVGLHPIGEKYNQFSPHGVTGFILLEESHISIHTWPEENFAALDIFSCRDITAIQEIYLIFQKYLTPTHIDTHIQKRGNRLTQPDAIQMDSDRHVS